MTRSFDVDVLLGLPDRVARLETDLVNALHRIEILDSRPSGADDELITVREAAELRGVSLAAMRKLTGPERHVIPVVRRGRSIFVRRRDAIGGGR